MERSNIYSLKNLSRDDRDEILSIFKENGWLFTQYTDASFRFDSFLLFNQQYKFVLMGTSNTEAITDRHAKINIIALEQASMVLIVANHPLRLQIIRLLEETRHMNTADIYLKLRIKQSVALRHLAALRRANIVITKRDGKAIYYSLNYKRISEVAAFVNEPDLIPITNTYDHLV